MDSGEVAALFDARADTYDESAAHRWQALVAVRALLDRVHIGTNRLDQLDVACGTGLVLRGLDQRLSESRTVRLRALGIDVSTASLAAARRRSGPECSYVAADAAALPVPDGAVDAITCVAGLPYLADVPAALTAWRRAAKDSGVLVLTVPADGGLPAFEILAEAAGAFGLLLDQPNAGLGSIEQQEQVLGECGWRLHRHEEVTYDEDLPKGARAADASAQGLIDYGHAQALSNADPALKEQVLERHRGLWQGAATRRTVQRIQVISAEA